MNLNQRIKARVVAFDRRARPWAGQSRARAFAYEFLLFGLKQAWACLFGAAMLALLLATALLWPDGAPLARYDFLFLAAIALQAALIGLGLEKPREALVILIFHVVGTAMEVFKTAHGSWSYPEESLFRIGGVPLFSGFMYACVGSYLARVHRLFDMRYVRFPPLWAPALISAAAYANFFSHHYLPDIRWGLFAASGLVFARTVVVYHPDLKPRRMPLLLGLVLVALFIWLAENLGTFANAWVYPDQRDGWRMVSVAKLGSWYLLMLLSFTLVCLIRRPRAPDPAARPAQPAPLADGLG